MIIITHHTTAIYGLIDKMRRGTMVLSSLHSSVVYLIFISVFLIYTMLLIGFNLIILVVAITFVYVSVNHRAVCRVVYLQNVNTIAIDFCGCLLPFIASLIIALSSSIDIKLFTILLSLSTMIASINTVLSSRSIIVNIFRYSISLFLISVVLFQSNNYYFYALPLITIMGIIIGSDILPYIFIHPGLRKLRKTLVIGGAKALDAINISTILVMLMAATYIAISKII